MPKHQKAKTPRPVVVRQRGSSRKPFDYPSAPPKKLTKGLKRHLAKVKLQNKMEYDRQMEMIP